MTLHNWILTRFLALPEETRNITLESVTRVETEYKQCFICYCKRQALLCWTLFSWQLVDKCKILQQIILYALLKVSRPERNEKFLLLQLKSSAGGKEETQILQLATGTSTQSVQAATRRKARHLTSDEHTDIFSLVVQSEIFKYIATGKSLAESSEKPFRNLWQSKFPMNIPLPPPPAWVHRDNMRSPKHRQTWTEGTAGKEHLWFMWSRDLLADYTKQRSVRFRQGQFRLWTCCFVSQLYKMFFFLQPIDLSKHGDSF